MAWLKGVGKNDAATTQAFDKTWSGDRPLLDKVAATLALGNPAAAQLLKEARDPDLAAPTSVPNLIKDQKLPMSSSAQSRFGLRQGVDKPQSL